MERLGDCQAPTNSPSIDNNIDNNMTTKLESFLSMSANAASIKGRGSIVDDTTSVTESVTEASSARSTIITHALTPQELINNHHQQGADPFDYTSVSAATDLDEDVNGVERVWFSSVSNRFSRFCIQETSTENIEGTVAVASSSDIAVKAPEEEEEEEEEREAEESNNNVHQRQTTKQNSPIAAAPKRKRVSFNESLNQCHEDAQQVMTLEEQEEYWYEKEMLDVFAENAALTCQVLVLNQPERAETFLQSYNKCCKTTSMAQQSKHHHHGHNGHHGGLLSERDLRRLLHYRHKVQLLYQAENNLSGLEHAVLGAIRGDPKSLRHFVLDHTKAFQERQGLTDAEQKRSIMAHFSACLSQPTQLLAHEMAVAFHTSLRLEEEQQQQSRQQQQ